MSSSVCEQWKKDVLESLDELDLIPIQGIQKIIIRSCRQMKIQDEYHQQRREKMENDTATYISSMRHVQFTTSSLQRKWENNTMGYNQISDTARYEPGTKEQAAMDWIKHMDKTTRDRSIVSDDFYDQFIDKYRIMRRQPPLLWIRHKQRSNTINGTPWKMSKKTQLLPMMTIPCLSDEKVAPISLITQDTLHLGPRKQKKLVDFGQKYQAAALFDEKVDLPERRLKPIHCVQRFGTKTCNGKISQKKPQPCSQSIDDDLIFMSTASPPTTSNSNNINNSNGSIKSDDNSSSDNIHVLKLVRSTNNSGSSLATPDVQSVRSTQSESISSPSTPPTPSNATLLIPKRRVAVVPAKEQQRRQEQQELKKHTEQQPKTTTRAVLGTIQYWSPKDSKPAQATTPPSSTPRQESSVISLSHSLFGSSNKHTSPTDTKMITPMTTTSISSKPSSPSRMTSPKQSTSTSAALSLDSLSIEDESQNKTEKVDSISLDHPSQSNSRNSAIDLHQPSQQEQPSTSIGVKHYYHQAAEKSPKKPAVDYNKPITLPIHTLGEKQSTTLSPSPSFASKTPPGIRTDKTQESPPSRKSSFFSPSDSLNDFLAIRRPSYRPVIYPGFGRGKVPSSSFSKSTSLKRNLCELDDPDYLYPAKKKEEWKLSSMGTGKKS